MYRRQIWTNSILSKELAYGHIPNQKLLNIKYSMFNIKYSMFKTSWTKRNTVCLKTQSVPRSKHSVWVIKTSHLTLCRQIIAVCSDTHTKHTNKLCGENVELLNVKSGNTADFKRLKTLTYTLELVPTVPRDAQTRFKYAWFHKEIEQK